MQYEGKRTKQADVLAMISFKAVVKLFVSVSIYAKSHLKILKNSVLLFNYFFIDYFVMSYLV